ncbi:MAG: septum formation initiator family protein [Rhodothermales bacterium]
MTWISDIKSFFLARRRLVLLGLGIGAIFWFLFLDSHSLWTRVQLHREHARLSAHNAAIAAEIEELETKLSRPLTDDEVERIAREEYGMQREDETVYPIEAHP